MIEVKEVSFSYNGSKKQTLSNMKNNLKNYLNLLDLVQIGIICIRQWEKKHKCGKLGPNRTTIGQATWLRAKNPAYM